MWGGAHLRIYIWHLLKNLKNNCLLKNCWSGPIKNARILIFTILYLKKKKEERKTPEYVTILHLCNKNLGNMIYSSWDIECDRMKLVIMDHFLPFYHYWLQQLIFGKNVKKTLEILFFYVYQKWGSYDVWFLKYKAQWTDFGHFGLFFAFWPS